MIKYKTLKIIFSLSFFSAITLLSGCSGMHSQFDCNAIGGIQSCETLGNVNRMADQGDFNRSGMQSAQSSAQANAQPTGYFLKTPGVDTPGSGEPLRFGDTLQNVWIAPYVTKDGSYMWASMASIIVTPGHWIGEPASSISQSGDV